VIAVAAVPWGLPTWRAWRAAAGWVRRDRSRRLWVQWPETRCPASALPLPAASPVRRV